MKINHIPILEKKVLKEEKRKVGVIDRITIPLHDNKPNRGFADVFKLRVFDGLDYPGYAGGFDITRGWTHAIAGWKGLVSQRLWTPS